MDYEQDEVLAYRIHGEWHLAAESDLYISDLYGDEVSLGEQCDECGGSEGQWDNPGKTEGRTTYPTLHCLECGQTYKIQWQPARKVVF